MDKLIAGYMQFRRQGYAEAADLLESLAHEQHPEKLFVTCSDSRVLPDWIVSAHPGDLFVLRNAGNIVPPWGDEAGAGEAATLEFAVSVLEVRHIIVCGHSDCGAIRALLHPETLDGLDSIRSWLSHAGLDPSIDSSLSDDEQVLRLADRNVLTQIQNLHTYPFVRDRRERGVLEIHGWVFDIASGRIRAWDPDSDQFLELE